MSKARAKPELSSCASSLGDAERIPYETDRFDRYVSAGSIEYWPDPEQGIREAYRVIKPDGLALVIGPLEPANPIIRWIACTWMLFPREEDYRKWFQAAGFTAIRVAYVRPQWYRGRHEYAVAIAGMKRKAGLSSTIAPPVQAKLGEAAAVPAEGLSLFGRVVIGSFLGFLFIPIALAAYFKNRYFGTDPFYTENQERLNRHQVAALLLTCAAVAVVGWIMW
jgi:MPBQ/MSBQ methyltransferase